ncbi:MULTISPECIES: phosphoethanolamine transferase [Aeromonas]|nr:MULTISPECIES: phosphoethanolamine--lipid A transferase [Aeromonas]AUT41447.1 phosphoethanolamine transferase [Aeromonas sp. ASNIH5]
MDTPKMKIKVVPFVLLVAFGFSLLQNWPILLHFADILLGLEHFKIGFAISIPIVLIAALNFVLMPFSIRYFVKPFFAFLFIAGSIVSYAMLKYRVIFDRDMVQNVLETNSGEAGAYLNLSVILWVALIGVLPAVLLFFVKIEYPQRWYRGLLARGASMLASLAVVGVVLALYYQDYASVGRNNTTLNKEVVPANYVYATARYVYKRYLQAPMPFQKIGEDATREPGKEKPTLMFLVVGETARGENLSMNGYAKETNPFTSKQENVVSFKDVRSCGTATAVSVPCMFSNMGRAGFDSNKARNSEGLLDVLQRTQVSVLWKENDGGCKGVCDRVPTIEIKPADFPALCDKETCFDEVMLENLQHEIANMKGDKLVAFHLIGSHGPTYYKRYPDEHRHFQPDCPRSDIENCTSEELMNTYDNTIRYTDNVVAKMIERLKQYEGNYNTALIYLSDHGESLGELGLYLHGTPYKFAPDEQTKVPFQVWMSPGYIVEKGMNMACLRDSAAAKSYSHDNLFSSVLGLWGVNSQVYNPELDMFQPCRTTQ